MSRVQKVNITYIDVKNFGCVSILGYENVLFLQCEFSQDHSLTFFQRLTIPKTCPNQFTQLMQDCWQVAPRERPSFKEILHLLDQMDENGRVLSLTFTDILVLS